MENRIFIRIGAGSAIIGAILFMVANILHPRSPNIEVNQAQIETVAASQIWLADHLLLLVGGMLMLGGLVALRRSITSLPGAAWAEFGYVSAIASTGAMVVLVGLDGIASKVVPSSPTALGIGLVIDGTRSNRPATTRSGWAMVQTGVLIFVVGGAFFELLIGLGGRQGDQLFWPILLIAVGAYFLIRRGRLSIGYRRPDTEVESGAEETQGAGDHEPADTPESDT